MTYSAIGIIVGLIIFLAAVPYAARIRHPEQRPLAGYLIFVSVFAVVSIVLFGLLAAMADALGLTALLERPLSALAFLILVFAPALLLARWQARKPPWRQGPPP